MTNRASWLARSTRKRREADPSAPRSLRAEHGYSLVEVLLVISLLTVVLGTLMAPLIESQKIENRDFNYAYSQQEARTAVESIVAQIRQATAILDSSPNKVEMNVTLSGVALTVGYECDITQPGSTQPVYHECVRVQAAQGNPLPSYSTGTVVAKNLLNPGSGPVFSFGPDPNAPYYMTATLQVPSSDGASGGFTHPIVLSDGTLMRNLNVAN